MENQVPIIVDVLYRYFVTDPNPNFWPEYIRDDPVVAHGLWSFYQGLRLGIQVSGACLDTL